MELRRLTATYGDDVVIEGWDSLIWTERYSTAGEFQLKTTDILGMIAKLPYDTPITHKETNQVMIVENYLIEEDNAGIDVLTISGRAYETVLERRIAANSQGNPWAITDTAGNIAVFLAGGFGNAGGAGAFAPGSVMSATNTTYLGDKLQYIFAMGEADINTNLDGSAVVSTLQTIPISDSYSAVMKVLAQDGLGIRTDRSNHSKTGLGLIVYRGDDRRVNHVPYDQTVTIDAARGDITKGSYLLSKKGYRNVGYPLRNSATAGAGQFISLNSVSDRNRVGYNNDALLPQDLARRDMIVDCTDIDVNVVGQGIVPLMLARNASALKATEATTVASVTASSVIPYKYGKDYYLGDFVTLRGSYGIQADLMVTEYIRVHDPNGDIGYPTLAGGA